MRSHYGQPNPLAAAKQMSRLDRHARAFIALSPLVVVASSDAAGRGDATPRGDAPGFVEEAEGVVAMLRQRLAQPGHPAAEACQLLTPDQRALLRA